MKESKKTLYWILSLLPLPCVLFLWFLYGFPESGEITRGVYYAEMLTIALTIVGVPASLKYVTLQRCGANYGAMCLLRMFYLCLVAVLELLLYYYLCATPTFFYLCIITWMSMFYAFPRHETKKEDDTLKEEKQ